jgi:hypothetical protein
LNLIFKLFLRQIKYIYTKKLKMNKLVFTYCVGGILLLWIGCKSEQSISENYNTNIDGKPFVKRRKPPVFSEILSKLDTNNDQKISIQEVKGPLKMHFNKIDSNNDGFITDAEFINAPPPPPPPLDENRKPPFKKKPSF